jgi:RNA polymerase sigma-70 factor, ECF subfamily
VLHDVFGVPFDAISETVGRPIGTCRQLARRARAKFGAAQPKFNAVASAEHQLVTEKFITACANGDIEGLTAVLDPTVWAWELSSPTRHRHHRSTVGQMRWPPTCCFICGRT